MVINLSKFSEVHEHTIPIVNGWGQVGGRKVYEKVEDGWYKIEVGDRTRVLRRATLLEIERALRGQKSYIGYAFGEEIIPVTFDSFRRKGMAETAHVHFQTTPLFMAARICQLADGRWYFYRDEPRFQRETLTAIRDCFDRHVGLQGLPGVTPEQRYLFVLARLYQNSYAAYQDFESLNLSESEKTKHLAHYTRDLGQRLRDVFAEVGATYRSHTAQGNSYIVEWEIGGQTIKSLINDELRIMNAGFCLSGDDELHTLHSLSLLARMFQQDGRRLYITRE